ncbi:MAG TPA: serine hydrolase [Gemmatimonadaceae bacterium]|nr:serine hydrolase [Gemmatimonadaceae bacterium]
MMHDQSSLARLVCSLAALTLPAITPLAAQDDGPTPAAPTTTRVGPSRGAVLVVGGGQLGPEIYARFIALAGGPDALIVDVPTAGGDSVYPPDWQGTRGLKAAGAKHVLVLHTVDRAVADADSFAAPLARAGGVWFEGGRQWHLVDSYAGTRTERAFHDVLARGGVVGGSSAGASILASYLLRGARSGNTIIMAPGYETGFGFLRGVAIDQHVVARERLADLADSLLPRHPELLGISEDEGTAWVVQGDTAEIIGRNKAFVYGGKDPTDPGAPFLTLRPGDRYDLAARHVIHRAIEDSRLTMGFIDSLFAPLAGANGAAATVLVAQNGEVLVDRSFGVPAQEKYMPTTTIPNFPLGEISEGFQAAAALLLEREGKLRLDDPLTPDGRVTVRQYLSRERTVPGGSRLLADLVGSRSGTSFPQFVERRLFTPIGAHRSTVSADGQLASNVDELYRWELGLESVRAFSRDSLSDAFAPVHGGAAGRALGWNADHYRGLRRESAYGVGAGLRSAFVRLPERHATIIILTDRDDVNARALAERIADRLLFTH